MPMILSFVSVVVVIINPVKRAKNRKKEGFVNTVINPPRGPFGPVHATECTISLVSNWVFIIGRVISAIVFLKYPSGENFRNHTVKKI